MEEVPININTADEMALATLPGISLKLAQRIVAHRQEHGPFTDVQELTAVSGISTRMIEQMADRITAEPIPAEIEPTPDTEVATAVPPATDAPENAPVGEPENSPEGEPESGPEGEEEIEPEVVILTLPPPAESEEPVTETDYEIATSTPQTLPEPGPPPPRRGSLVGSLIAALFGAILGTTLTLSILYGFNQTLQFASSAQASDLQLQLAAELTEIQQTQQQIQNDLAALNSQVETLAAEQGENSTAVATVQANVAQLQTAAADLQTRADDLTQRLDAVAESAEDFDTFLTGLRDLLVHVAGPLPTPAPTATPTETPTPAPTDAAPTATATTDPAFTRTPRPTATPIGLPTGTATVSPQP
ncbi:MAG: helix-hairpin-helix domain-containing protein [Anaerolineae bacterium]|nr:helix-hairpin-helix domain-containing protein [Anaerolineae bacterium]